MTEPSERWYTTADLARLWGCHPSTVRLKASQGGIRGFKIFGQWRFRASDVAAFEAAAVNEAPQ